MNPLATLLAFLAVVALAAPAAAAPVPEDERVPLDLRRTTLVVADMERSLAFYRDALGMVVTYDHWIYTPREAKSADEAEVARRLVFLRANDTYIGVLGLLEYTKPEREPVEIAERPFHPGTTVLVFNLEDNRAAFARASKVEGAGVLWAPEEVTYPDYGGDGVLRVVTSGVHDPDGFAVEINQLLDAVD